MMFKNIFFNSPLPRVYLNVMDGLFKQDVFCRPQYGFYEVSARERLRIKNLLTKSYGNIGTVRAIDRLPGNNINSLNYRISTVRGVFLLKKMSVRAAEEKSRLAHLQKIVQASHQESLNLPEMVPATDGSLLSWGNDAFWLVMDWLPGVHYDGQEACLKKIFEAIAQLNVFLGSFPGGRQKRFFKTYSFYEPTELQGFLKYQQWYQRSKTGNKDLLERNLRFSAETIFSCFDPRTLRLISETFVPEHLTHIDLHPHNILVTKSGRVSFLDLDSISFSHRLPCIGYAMFKLVRNYVVAHKTQKNLGAKLPQVRNNVTRLFIKYGIFNESEVKTLALGARAMILKRMMYILRDYFFLKRRTWAHLFLMHHAALRESEFIFGIQTPNHLPPSARQPKKELVVS